MALKWTRVSKFLSGDISVEFVPVDNVPGYSHRVILLRRGQVAARDWYDNKVQPLSNKVAEYYAQKHKLIVSEKP